jgi:hypothetical protein
MRKLAVAQLGSEEIDQARFVELLVIKTVKVLLSDIFRKLGLAEVAGRCEAVTDLKNAYSAAAAATVAARTFFSAGAILCATDATDATDAAYAAYAARTADDATDAAGAAAHATYSADKDYYLKLSAGLALECLQELNSPGCEFLYLCEF